MTTDAEKFNVVGPYGISFQQYHQYDIGAVADLPWRGVVQLRQGAGPEGGAWNPDFFLNYNIFSGFDLGFAAVDMRVDV